MHTFILAGVATTRLAQDAFINVRDFEQNILFDFSPQLQTLLPTLS
jgi:hypothetical protein